MRLIGIDPGLSGALALFDGGKFVTVIDLPFINGDLDAMTVREWLEAHRPKPPHRTRRRISAFRLRFKFQIGSRARLNQGCVGSNRNSLRPDAVAAVEKIFRFGQD